MAHLASPEGERARRLESAKPTRDVVTSDKQPASRSHSKPHLQTVVVRPAGAKWAVRVVPPLGKGDFDGCFAAFKDARARAAELQAFHAFAIDDGRGDQR